jgi:hypothetical protein
MWYTGMNTRIEYNPFKIYYAIMPILYKEGSQYRRLIILK